MSMRQYHRLPRCASANWIRKSPAYRPLSMLSGRAWLDWAWTFIRYGIGPRLRLPSRFGQIQLMPDKTSVAIAGDWATDTWQACDVARLIASDDPDFTLNLGDTYFVGDPKETLQNAFGVYGAEDGLTSEKWPIGKRGSRWLLGNHEMMARGTGYFRVILPRLKQATSWFSISNTDWTILGLDTGYNSASLFHRDAALPKQCVEWLRSFKESKLFSERALILLTHHQPISAFDNSEYPAAAIQLEEIIDRPVLWFWGHEHRAAAYGPWKVRPRGFTFYGHCAGHGGMPVYANDEIERKDRPLRWADTRTQKVDGIDVGYNGYVSMDFDGPKLILKYIDINSVVLRTEHWTARNGIPI